MERTGERYIFKFVCMLTVGPTSMAGRIKKLKYHPDCEHAYSRIHIIFADFSVNSQPIVMNITSTIF